MFPFSSNKLMLYLIYYTFISPNGKVSIASFPGTPGLQPNLETGELYLIKLNTQDLTETYIWFSLSGTNVQLS